MKFTEALIRDLEKLQAELPSLIMAVRSGDDAAYEDAKALVQGAARDRIAIKLDALTDYVLKEWDQGNKRPLQVIALGCCE